MTLQFFLRHSRSFLSVTEPNPLSIPSLPLHPIRSRTTPSTSILLKHRLQPLPQPQTPRTPRSTMYLPTTFIALAVSLATVTFATPMPEAKQVMGPFNEYPYPAYCHPFGRAIYCDDPKCYDISKPAEQGEFFETCNKASEHFTYHCPCAVRGKHQVADGLRLWALGGALGGVDPKLANIATKLKNIVEGN